MIKFALVSIAVLLSAALIYVSVLYIGSLIGKNEK